MLFKFRLCGHAILAALLAGVITSSAGFADDRPAAADSPHSAALPANIKRIIHHGRILAGPTSQPENTHSAVAYELGRCLQLDRDHCLIVASMDEQGGGDLCVGNDCFVIQKLSDLVAEKAIPLNRSEVNHVSGAGAEKRFLAKYPALGTFVPLGARLPNGKSHPAAGTGLLFSGTSTFRADKTTQDEKSKRSVEVIQLRWDGSTLQITSHELVTRMLDLELSGSIPLANCSQDDGLLFSLGTVADGVIVYRFDWNGQAWAPTRHGKRFAKTVTEGETSLRQQGNKFYLQTRCHGADGNLYQSKDGLEYEFVATLDTHAGSPKVLNQGLDGSLYVACNYSPGWVRNPLEAVPWEEDHFGKPFVLYDQDGVRGDRGNSKPFVDHAIASNVYLEGRWRHLILYRVCDLMERSLHGFQLKQGIGDVVYGKGKGPIPRRPWSGMYAIELEYEHVTAPPYKFD
jgi:hypothetical protein